MLINRPDSRDDSTGKIIPGTLAEQCDVIYRAMGEILHRARADYQDIA